MAFWKACDASAYWATSPVSRPFSANSSPRYWYCESLEGLALIRACQNAMRLSVSEVSTAPVPPVPSGGAILVAGSSAAVAAGRLTDGPAALGGAKPELRHAVTTAPPRTRKTAVLGAMLTSRHQYAMMR